MKFIITRSEIRAKFQIPAGVHLEIPHERKPVIRKRKKKVETTPKEQPTLPI